MEKGPRDERSRFEERMKMYYTRVQLSTMNVIVSANVYLY